MVFPAAEERGCECFTRNVAYLQIHEVGTQGQLKQGARAPTEIPQSYT